MWGREKIKTILRGLQWMSDTILRLHGHMLMSPDVELGAPLFIDVETEAQRHLEPESIHECSLKHSVFTDTKFKATHGP